jgi:DNA-binding response OmpR family regulator
VTLPRENVPVALLVDADPGVVATLAAALRWAGFEVLCVESPMAALATALYTETPIELLVTAVLMPGMDGPELARELARYHPETRTLFIGTRPDSEVAAREVIGRGCPFLAKPFSARAFLDAVGAILGPAHAGKAGTVVTAAVASHSA